MTTKYDSDIRFRNVSGDKILRGAPVMLVGAVGQHGLLTGALMDASDTANAEKYLGMATSDVIDGAEGHLRAFGDIRAANTSAWGDGDVLYCDPETPGALTATKPTAGLVFPVAVVSRAHPDQGVLQVKGAPAQSNVATAEVNPVTGRIGFPLEGQWSDNLQLLRAQIIGKTPEFYETLSGVTITLGSANGNPTIASAVTIAKDSAVLSHSCRTEVGSTWPNSQYRYPMTKDNKATGTASGYATGDVSSSYLETNAATLEFAIKGVGISAKGRIWVTQNGVRRIAGVIPTVPSDGERYWVKVEFGSAAMRTVEIEIVNGYFGGFAVGPSDLYARHELSGLHVMVVGDSYTEGTGTTNGVLNLDGYANRLARLLGAQRRTMSGLGGTGYLANNSNARKSLLERVQTDVIDLAPDIVIHANGINDTLEGINSNAPQVFDTIKAALPNCVQIVFGPFQPRSIDVEARRAALQAICAARGLLFIDNVTDDEITGTGYQSSPQRDGNSDIVIGGADGTDVTHPTLFGHEYIARWRYKALCRAIGI